MAKFNDGLIATMKSGNAKKVYVNEAGEWLFYPRDGFKEFSRAEVCGEESNDAPNYSKKTVAELLVILKEKGIEAPEGAKKADLLALLAE